MLSSYKPIGNYIRLVDERNTGLHTTNLLGVSISKQFIKSVANVIGTDMENYKVIRKNQFACSIMQVRRDRKMPVALYTNDEPALISQAYPIFELTDTTKLLPEYLMMWFTRSEFDREACFYAVGGVRGSLEWGDFCNMKLPIPSPEKQLEIVKEYNVIQNRIKLNNQLIAKLEETAQAIYKQWFVDFEFPDENDLPYKSNGGEMVDSELGEIPRGWEIVSLADVTLKVTDGSHTSPSSTRNGYPMASVKDMYDWGLNLKLCRKISEDDYKKLIVNDCQPLKSDILIAKDGSFLKHIFVVNETEEVVILSSIAIIRPNDKIISNLLSLYLKQDATKRRMTNVVNGGAIQRIILKEFKRVQVLLPIKSIQIHSNKLINPLLVECWKKSNQNQKLLEIKDLLLSKMIKVETEIYS